MIRKMGIGFPKDPLKRNHDPIQSDRIMIERKKMEFASEFWRFMRVRKKFWLLPILIMTFVFGGLVVLTKGSAIAPFVYTLF
jgi:hypothetical protein